MLITATFRRASSSYLISSLSTLLLICYGLPTIAVARPLECAHLNDLFSIYFKQHYVHKNLTPEIKKHTVEKFINSLESLDASPFA